jgi:hypothetical protein
MCMRYLILFVFAALTTHFLVHAIGDRQMTEFHARVLNRPDWREPALRRASPEWRATARETASELDA